MVALGRGCFKQEPRYDFLKIRTVNAAYRGFAMGVVLPAWPITTVANRHFEWQIRACGASMNDQSMNMNGQ